MKITYLKLDKFKKMPFHTGSSFEMDLTASKLFGFIGCNGSGKSSLLRELSPLPTSKEYFESKGYKEIHIEHLGKNYVLVCDFGSVNPYSFKVDDEELNPSGLLTVQKDLVRQHFGINDLVFEIMIGSKTFTSLTTQERKKLFNELTNINIDDIINLHDDYKRQLKDEEAVYKHLVSSLTIEKDKLENEDNIKSIQGLKEVLLEGIDKLLQLVPLDTTNGKDVKQTIHTLYEQLKLLEDKIKNQVKHFQRCIAMYPYRDMVGIEAKLQAERSHLELLKNRLHTSIHEKELELKDLEELAKVTIKEVDAKIKEIEKTSKAMEDSLKYLSITSDTDALRQSLIRVDDRLHNIIDLIQEFNIEDFRKDKVQDTINRQQRLTTEKEDIIKRINLFKGKISNITDTEYDLDIECDNCGHRIQREIQKDILNKLNEVVESLEIKRVKIENELSAINVYLDKYNQLKSLLNNYKAIKEQFPDLSCIFEEIDKRQLLLTSPDQIHGLISHLRTELIYIERLKENTAYLNELTLLRSKQTLNENKDAKKIQKELCDLKIELDDVISKLLINAINKKQLNYMKLVYENLTNLTTLRKETINKIMSSHSDYVLQNFVKEVRNEIISLRGRVVELEKEINKYNELTHTIKALESKIELSKDRMTVLKHCIDELSPRNGLIAKLISSYLNSIIGYINSFIKEIMDYKMELLLIDVEHNKLDYKFKIKVEDKLEVKDISQASSGMKEIIDLAFKLVFYRILKFKHYPLYLDEFGVRLDASHRNRIHSMIFNFINDDYYSQVFLVTHLDFGILSHKDSQVISLS